MSVDESNPGDFISLSSSEDEGVSLKNNKRSHDESEGPAGLNAQNASDEPLKRARISSVSADSAAGNRVSEEGEIDERDLSGDEGEISNGDDIVEKPESLAQATVIVPSTPPVFIQDSQSYDLPVFSPKREGPWLARFKAWIQTFCEINSQHAALLNPDLVVLAFRQYLDLHSGLKASKKRAAKQVAGRKEGSKALASILASVQTGIKPQSANSPAQSSSKQPGSVQDGQTKQLATSGKEVGSPENHAIDQLLVQEGGLFAIDVSKKPLVETTPSNLELQSLNPGTMVQIEGAPSGEDALAQQQRYFPSASDPTQMCLFCGCEGHIASNCSNYACKFCGRSDHWDYICPTIKERCSKCSQLGHSASKCTEKLVLTRDEGLACSCCSSPNHLEVDCTEIWRSFHVSDQAIKAVTALPVSCATCGSGQHYAADCQNGSSYAPNPTWSLANRDVYLDPECSSAAIEGEFMASNRNNANQSLDIKIRGHASRPTHIHYSESDDSDTEFLGQRAAGNKSSRIGQIRVSSNLQMPNGKQPPLPPGPPPGLPLQPTVQYPPPLGVSGYGASQPSAASPGLPARPPAGSSALPARPPAARDYTNVPPPPPASQDHRNQSGRSGRRGRGGGRGGRGGQGAPRGRGGQGGGNRGSYHGGKFRGGKAK